MLPVCPFCRKNVEPGAVWCVCGVNLSRYPKLPTAPKEIKEWLLKYAPEEVSTFAIEPGQMLVKAKESLVKEQDSQVNEKTQQYLELASAEKLIAEFLQACEREMLAPTLDIGQLRRERWRQWRHIPAQYRLHPPLKDFRVKPGYLIQIPVSKYVEEFCLAIDGSLYKHQLNAQDPFPLEEMLKLVPTSNLAEALNTALVELLKTKQQPAVESRGFLRRKKRETAKEQQEQPEQAEATTSRRSFFNRKKEQVGAEQGQPQPQPQTQPSKEAVAQAHINNNENKSKLSAIWQMLRRSKTVSENQSASEALGSETTTQPVPTPAGNSNFVPLDELSAEVNRGKSEQEGAKVITVKVGQALGAPKTQESKENQEQAPAPSSSKTIVSE